jgi:hypothetical protein
VAERRRQGRLDLSWTFGETSGGEPVLPEVGGTSGAPVSIDIPSSTNAVGALTEPITGLLFDYRGAAQTTRPTRRRSDPDQVLQTLVDLR